MKQPNLREKAFWPIPCKSFKLKSKQLQFTGCCRANSDISFNRVCQTRSKGDRTTSDERGDRSGDYEFEWHDVLPCEWNSTCVGCPISECKCYNLCIKYCYLLYFWFATHSKCHSAFSLLTMHLSRNKVLVTNC